MLPASEGVVFGNPELEPKNVVHPQPRDLPDLVCIVRPGILSPALHLIIQIGRM